MHSIDCHSCLELRIFTKIIVHIWMAIIFSLKCQLMTQYPLFFTPSYINSSLCHSKPCIYVVHLTISELPSTQTQRSDKDRRQASISSKRPIFFTGS